MRLYQQLVLFMLAATVLPLAVVGFYLLRESERELSRRILAEQRALASAAAERTAGELSAVIDALERTAAPFALDTLEPEELKGALALLYRQSPRVAAVEWAPGPGGPPGSQVFVADGSDGHPGFDAEKAGSLTRRIPLAPLAGGQKGQVALSGVYPHSTGQGAAVTVAIKVNAQPDSPFVLAELGLASIEESLREKAPFGSGVRIDLVDRSGMVVAS
jgi:two-component system NtrC family sensor kinase